MREKQEKRCWSRREFLTGAGVAIGLPFFPSLFPRTAWADGVTPPTRLLFMSVPFGFVPNKWLLDGPDGYVLEILGAGNGGWFPQDDGAAYKLPEVHAGLEPYRQHISFLKGLSNRRYRADAHNADDVFLTCADTFADPSKGFSNTISCDQLAANSEAMGGKDVRYRGLALSGTGPFYGTHTGGLSWTPQGVPISPMSSPAQVFDCLFGKDDLPAATRLLRFKEQKSVLDMTRGQIAYLNRRLNAADRRKLDEVVTAVEEVEADIQREEKWIDIPKPKPPGSLTRPDQNIGMNSTRHTQTMFDLIHAAFLTDSTRVVTYEMPQTFNEVTHFNKHELNHPSGDPEKAKDAVKQDRANSEQIAYLAKLMSDSKEHDGQPLIHHMLAAYGSGVWGPNHGLRSLPIMMIGHGGGKIKQGMTRKYDNTTPLANLWLTMLKTCGVPVNSFGDSTGTLDGLLK